MKTKFSYPSYALFALTLGVPMLLLANELNCPANSLKLGCILQRQLVRMVHVIQLFLALAYVSGYGFIIAAIFKFKQVRENPQQVPVSTPFAFLLTAILLIFIPGLIQFAGITIFNISEQRVSLSGHALANIQFIDSSLVLTPDSSTLADPTLFGMVRRVTDMFPSLTLVVVSSAYIAGLGFALAALFKMKAVRDAPQQNPITIPISYMIVSVLLIYMPDIVKPTSQTLFGDSVTARYAGGGAGQNFTTLVSTP